MSNREFKNEFANDKIAQVKGNAMSAMDTTKDVIIQLQKGKAVVTVVKGALKKAPGCPESLKALLATPYGDLVVGLILHTTAPILTASPTIISAVKAANIAGAVELSNQFTFIQDAIEQAIESIPGMSADEVKQAIKDKVDTTDDTPDTPDTSNTTADEFKA